MTRKKVFWNRFALAMVNSFIKRQVFLSIAIIWLFMLQATTEEAAAVAKLPGQKSPLLPKDCPSFCECKWKKGKETVECVNANLTSVPEGLNADTQVLDLGRNHFPRLPTDIFRDLGLTNLQKIYLSHCSVEDVEENSFSGLTNLVDLDLSYNRLTRIPTTAIVGCKYLMRLSLKGNVGIREVSGESFSGIKDLYSLDLSECGIENVTSGAFTHLDKLRLLKLESNSLITLSPGKVFPSELRDLTLHQNSWYCDCNVLELHYWLQNFTVPNSIEPKCKAPSRLAGEEIKSLQQNEFACKPEVSPTTMFLEVVVGKNMSLICNVEAVPDANIMWKYKETLINNGSTLVDDIDLRSYFHIETNINEGHHLKANDQSSRTSGESQKDDKKEEMLSRSGVRIKSELFLTSTSVDDNGTFACIASNSAGITRATFTLHVVVPLDPPPPLDVVEERFDAEYLIAIAAAIGLLTVIAAVALALMLMRCRRNAHSRAAAKRRKKRSSLAADSTNSGGSSTAGGGFAETDFSSASCGSSIDAVTGQLGPANGSSSSSAIATVGGDHQLVRISSVGSCNNSRTSSQDHLHVASDHHQRDRVILRTSQDGIIGGGKSTPGGPEDFNNTETVDTQIMANGMVSISENGNTCNVFSAQNFDKKRSKSSEKICDEKAKRWVRSSSQEYDEVSGDSHQISRCQSGGTSEAAVAAANLAMQTLRRHYGDTIPIGGSDIKSLKSSEYLNNTEQMTLSSISKPAINKLSLPLTSTNFEHIQQQKNMTPLARQETTSPTPPPPPPHRNLTSPSKHSRNRQEMWAQHTSQQLTPPKPFADTSASDESSSVVGDNGEDYGFVAATLPHLPNPLSSIGSPTSSSTSSSQTPSFQQLPPHRVDVSYSSSTIKEGDNREMHQNMQENVELGVEDRENRTCFARTNPGTNIASNELVVKKHLLTNFTPSSDVPLQKTSKNVSCNNKWNRGGNVFSNELECGASIGSSSSSSTNSSSVSYNNTMDTSVMSSISSNSSISSSSGLSKKRAANINQSFQKHFQNLTALERPQHFEQHPVESRRPNGFEGTDSCSSSNSLASLDRRLCKTLPRKLTKGIIGTNTELHQTSSKIETGNCTAESVADVKSTLSQNSSMYSANSTNENEFDKRNSDPYLDASTKVVPNGGIRSKGSAIKGAASQRHSFGGLIVHRVVPAPAKYKGVHFAPNIEVSKRDKTPSPEKGDKGSEIPIPTEGLPTRPARAPHAISVSRTSSHSGSSIIIPKTSETVPIVVKNVSDRPSSDKIISSVTNHNSLGIADNMTMARRSSSLTFNKGPSKTNET